MSTYTGDRRSPALQPDEAPVDVLEAGHDGSRGGDGDEGNVQPRVDKSRIVQRKQGNAQSEQLKKGATFPDETRLRGKAFFD